jgi:hypothetical protein
MGWLSLNLVSEQHSSMLGINPSRFESSLRSMMPEVSAVNGFLRSFSFVVISVTRV